MKNKKDEHRLKLQIEYWRKRANELLKKDSATEQLIQHCQAALSVFKPYPPFKIFTKSTGKGRPQSLVILFSDSQLGTEVVGQELGDNVEDYSTEVFRYRLRLLLKGISILVRRQLNIAPIHTCHLFLLGDIIENETVFQPQMTFIDTNVLNQFFIAQHEVSRFIASLSRIFPKVEITCIRGNHGRVGSSHRDHNELVNWEHILYTNIAYQLQRYKNVTFDIPLAWWRIKKVEKRRILLIHGDDIKRWMNFPFYGIDRTAKSYSEAMQGINRPFDDLVLGHFHVPHNWQTAKGEVFVNGSFVGATKFVFKQLHTTVRPSQWIFLVHPEQGIADRFLFRLDKKDTQLRAETKKDGYDIKTAAGSLYQIPANPIKIKIP